MKPIDKVLTRLQERGEVKQSGGGYSARCPAHDDHNPSLSISEGDNGGTLVKCFAGCEAKAIVAALGLTMADLMPESSATARTKSQAKQTPMARKIYATPENAYRDVERERHGKFVQEWLYPGDTFRVARFNQADSKKTFCPMHKVIGGWVRGDPPGPLPLYRGDEIGNAGLPGNEPLFIVEGEKCADIARSVGLIAVTSSHGSGSAGKTDWTPCAGRNAITIRDNDEKGEKYAQDVAVILTKLNLSATVKIVPLPGLGDGGDIVDWIDADGPMGSKTAEEIKEAILDLAEKTAYWAPPAVALSSAKIPEQYCPFPVDCLPEPIRSFVVQSSEAIGCDAAFVALPLLAEMAAAIGNTLRIQLKSGWTEPAILWMAIVGDSGTQKSPAMECALKPLRRRQQEAFKKYEEALKIHKQDQLQYEADLTVWKRGKDRGLPPLEPQEPVQLRYCCDDTTIEALAPLLKQNWRGLLMARDELAGWLNGFDRYAKSGGGEVAKWLEMFGGRSITVDRKTGNPKTIFIPCAAVSIAGGIQPGTLQCALGKENFENGLAARFLLVWPPRRAKKWTEAEIDSAMQQSVAEIFDRLLSIEPIVGEDDEPRPCIVQLSAEAKRVWVKFYNEHAKEHVNLSGDLSAAWSKLECYAARLTLVVHAIRWAASNAPTGTPDDVDEISVAAGVELSRWFGQETRRIYAMLSESVEDRQCRLLVERIQRLGGSITVRELMRSADKTYPTAEVAEQELNGLVQAGLGYWKEILTSAKGGHPTRRFFLANSTDTDTTPVFPANGEVVSVSAINTPPKSLFLHNKTTSQSAEQSI